MYSKEELKMNSHILNRSKFVALATASLLLCSVALPTLASAAKTSRSPLPNTSEECVDKYKRVNNVEKLKSAVNAVADSRTSVLNSINDRVAAKSDAIPSGHSDQLNKLLKEEVDKIKDLQASAANESNAQTLVTNFCKIKFENRFIIKKVRNVLLLDRVVYFDKKLTEVLNHPANQENKTSGPLKSEIDKRLNQARKIVADNDEAGLSANSEAALAAKNFDELFNAFNDEESSSIINNLKRAAKNHTESWVLRAASKEVNGGQTAELVSIELKAAESEVDDDQTNNSSGKNKTCINCEQQDFDGLDTVTINGVVYTSAEFFSKQTQQAIASNFVCFENEGGGNSVFCAKEKDLYNLESSVRDDSHKSAKDGFICYRNSDPKEGTAYLCAKPAALEGGGNSYSIRILPADEYNKYVEKAKQAEGVEANSATTAPKSATVKVKVGGNVQTIELVRNDKTFVWEVQ
jgi:protein-arginine kinase activator protein McsA